MSQKVVPQGPFGQITPKAANPRSHANFQKKETMAKTMTMAILCQWPLRDAFLAQNTILSAQKAPAGRFSGSKYNLIRQKGRCGTLVSLKIQFCLPKRPLRDDFLTFKISKNVFPGIFFGFEICNLKLFALRKSFEHSPKPSTHPNYIVFYDYNNSTLLAATKLIFCLQGFMNMLNSILMLPEPRD